MSLGLEHAGYELYFANELSPMAGETFAHNLLNETLEEDKIPSKVLWIKSQFSKRQITKRLRENPLDAPLGKYSDIENDTILENKLLIGDLNELLKIFEEKPDIGEDIIKEIFQRINSTEYSLNTVEKNNAQFGDGESGLAPPPKKSKRPLKKR